MTLIHPIFVAVCAGLSGMLSLKFNEQPKRTNWAVIISAAMLVLSISIIAIESIRILEL